MPKFNKKWRQVHYIDSNIWSLAKFLWFTLKIRKVIGYDDCDKLDWGHHIPDVTCSIMTLLSVFNSGVSSAYFVSCSKQFTHTLIQRIKRITLAQFKTWGIYGDLLGLKRDLGETSISRVVRDQGQPSSSPM